MLWKFNKIRSKFLIALIILCSSFNYVQATNEVCEIIEVDKRTPLVNLKYPSSYIASLIQEEQTKYHLTLEKAKGRAGEILARNVIEDGYIDRKSVV